MSVGRSGKSLRVVADAGCPLGDGRRRIVVDADLHRVVGESAGALADDKEVFERNHRLVHVVGAGAGEPGIAAGVPIVREVSVPLVRTRLSSVAEFVRPPKRDGAEPKAIAPPSDVAAAVLDLGAWPGVHSLVGVIETPFLRSDGSVVQAPGYDPQSGYLYRPSASFPAVPDKPSHDDARRALAELAEVFGDFPFASEASRSVPLAAILTLLARPAIRGAVPAFVHEANTRGAGKSLATDAIGLVATGRPTAKMSWPSDPDELEKVLAAFALRGASLIDFDNVVAPFGGGPLDRSLTAVDRVELRVLGKSEIPSIAWRAVVLATGNNVQLVGDTARRVLVCRIESPLENPEDRSDFRHPDLRGWLGREWPRLVVAGLTLLRAWVVAGRPRCDCPSWGSFEAWSATIPTALVWAGTADPMGARPAVSGHEDEDKAALVALVEGLPRLDPGGHGMALRDVLGLLYTDRGRGGPPDGFDGLRDALEHFAPPRGGGHPDGRLLGNRLRKMVGRVVGGRKLVTRSGRAGTIRWAVECGGSGESGGSVSTQGPNFQEDHQNQVQQLELTHQTHQTHHDEDDEREAIVGESAPGPLRAEDADHEPR